MDTFASELTIALSTGKGTDKYPAKSHARRVAEKLAVQCGVVLLFGSPNLLYPGSNLYQPFRQNRDFFYLSGCNEPDTRVTYNIEDDHLTLWLPAINEDKVVWNGRGSTVEEAMEKYDIDCARYYREGRSPMPPAYSSGSTYCFDDGHGQPSEPVRLREALDTCRLIKDEHEIALIKRANEITTKAQKTVMKKLYKFKSEADVEGAFMNVCIANHAKTQAYDPIAGAGRNAAILHYMANSGDFGAGQTLVLDAGCEFGCYASDVTRTLPLNHKRPGYWPSKEAESIYKLVEDMQEACIREMKPGAKFQQISSLADRVAVSGLIRLGILKGKLEDIIARGTQRGFFPHGLGHSLGLDVHDVVPLPQNIAGTPVMSSTFGCSVPVRVLDSEQTSAGLQMQPGMVWTIEPGIYFSRFLLGRFYLSDPKHAELINRDVLERYMANVGGVRIEDDILITKTGHENLTTTPKGDAMLKVIRKAAKKHGRLSSIDDS